MSVSYVQEGDWPTRQEMDFLGNGMVTVKKVRVIRDGDGTEARDPDVDYSQHVKMIVTLVYGCTHTKMPHLGAWGKWVCADGNCPMGVQKVRGLRP